ncbi:MAG: hypothetical protein IJ558_05310 [Treponema sp.]|nr:hypothetical protein [Treponema sp.]
METVLITVFTDPMMGLSYESEPVLEKVENFLFSRHSVSSGDFSKMTQKKPFTVLSLLIFAECFLFSNALDNECTVLRAR